MPRIGTNATSRIAGACSPTVAAREPIPMPMLVVAAVLEAAMAMPSTTPRERRRPGGSLLMIDLLTAGRRGWQGSGRCARGGDRDQIGLASLRQWCCHKRDASGDGGERAVPEGRIPVERRRRKPTRSGVLLSEDVIVDCAL